MIPVDGTDGKNWLMKDSLLPGEELGKVILLPLDLKNPNESWLEPYDGCTLSVTNAENLIPR